MASDLEMMEQLGLIKGGYDAHKVGDLPPGYWLYRYIYLDFRGDLRLSNMVTFGPHVSIVTASHDFSNGKCGDMVLKRVWVDEGAFIGGFSLLYNCHVKHHGIVACGSVVRNMVVEPFEMVEGNPARVVKRFQDGHWVPVERD